MPHIATQRARHARHGRIWLTSGGRRDDAFVALGIKALSEKLLYSDVSVLKKI
jgi:hypothetical protein